MREAKDASSSASDIVYNDTNMVLQLDGINLKFSFIVE
jgi:hypothetical protein